MPGQRPGGVGQYFDGPIGDPGRLLVREVHTSTCSHCQAQTEFASQRAMLDHVDICRGCMKLICLACVGQPCRPWEKEAERQEREALLNQRLQVNMWRCY